MFFTMKWAIIIMNNGNNTSYNFLPASDTVRLFSTVSETFFISTVVAEAGSLSFINKWHHTAEEPWATLA